MSSALPSPPITRLRTRKASGEIESQPSSSGASKGKSKSKHVEFSESVEITRLPSPSPDPEESDLTDLTEVEQSLMQAKPSPRRLRSKSSMLKLTQERRLSDEVVADGSRRVTPMRKAKGKVENLHESTDEEDEEDELLPSDHECNEIDELQESPSPMATPKAKSSLQGRRTPVRNRLRNRHLQTHTPPSDGDDEDSEEEGTVVAGEDGDDEGSDHTDDETLAEPRTLRNGKVVGEGDVEEDIGEDIGEEDEDGEEDEEDDEEDDDDTETVDSESIASTIDDPDIDEEESMEDDGTFIVNTAWILTDLP